MRQWGAGLGLRATAFAMLSAACALGAGLAVAPPPMDLRLPLLGVVLALLTGAAGSLTAAGARRAASVVVERVAPALTPAPPSTPLFAPSPPPERSPASSSASQDHAELAAATRDLRNLLAEQRAELAAFREQTETSAHETTMLGARLAGLALDAEVRLSAVIEHAAEASQRAERTLPEFAELLRRGLAERSAAAPSSDSVREAIQAGAAAAVAAASSRFDAAVEGAARSLGAVMADASGQIAALADVAVALRRDAVALDEAAGAVATAGAGVIGGVADAMGHAESFARAVEETRVAAQAAIDAAAQGATQGLIEAAAALRREAEHLLAAAIPLDQTSLAAPIPPIAIDHPSEAKADGAEAPESCASPSVDLLVPTPEPDLSPSPAAPPAQEPQPARASTELVEQLMGEVGEVMRRLRAMLDQQSAAEAPPEVAPCPRLIAVSSPPMAQPAMPLEQRVAPADAPPLSASLPPTPPPQEPASTPSVDKTGQDGLETIETTIRRLREMAAALENGSLSASQTRKVA